MIKVPSGGARQASHFERSYARYLGEVRVEGYQFDPVVDAQRRDQQVHRGYHQAAVRALLPQASGVAPQVRRSI